MKKMFLVALLGLMAAGCASAQAKSPAARPDLDVPPPPPRVIETITVPDAPPPPERVDDLPSVPASPRPRPAPPVRDPAKAEPKADPAPVEQPPAPAATVQAPVPPLRTPGTPNQAEAARQVNEVLDRAKRALASIDYQRLSTDRRSQYDTAKLLIAQSEDALKTTNFDIARNLADKAERMAKELSGH